MGRFVQINMSTNFAKYDIAILRCSVKSPFLFAIFWSSGEGCLILEFYGAIAESCENYISQQLSGLLPPQPSCAHLWSTCVFLPFDQSSWPTDCCCCKSWLWKITIFFHFRWVSKGIPNVCAFPIKQMEAHTICCKTWKRTDFQDDEERFGVFYALFLA